MDLVRMDRDVAAAMLDVKRDATKVDWDVHRHVAGQRALRDLETLGASQVALRDALSNAVKWLTVERVSQPAERALAEARTTARVVVRLEQDVEVAAAELVSGMLAARSAHEARAYFAAWPGVADALRGPERTLHETRGEAFHRLGVDDVPLHFLGKSRRDLASNARAFLASTTDLARECERGQSGETPWPLHLDVRLGRRASDGWPARLTWRTVAALLPGIKANVSPGTCPAALGAASFALALAMLGEAFRRAAHATSMPFALREPPLFADISRTGHVFASVLCERTFHARVLGLSPGRARDQARLIASAYLLHARAMAARVALGEPDADYEALTALAFGAPLSMRGAWPNVRDEHYARFVALLGTLDRLDALRNREGDDWFRNPRAFGTLRDLVQTPVEVVGSAPLQQRFEELLG